MTKGRQNGSLEIKGLHGISLVPETAGQLRMTRGCDGVAKQVRSMEHTSCLCPWLSESSPFRAGLQEKVTPVYVREVLLSPKRGCL